MSTPPARSLVNPPPPNPPPPPESGAAAQPAAPEMRVAFPPDLAQMLALTSTQDYLDDVKIDHATDGTGRARSFYITPKAVISAALRGISEAEWMTFDSFYRSNRLQPFTIPWGSCASPVLLPVMFASTPKREYHGLGRSTVTFGLIEFP